VAAAGDPIGGVFPRTAKSEKKLPPGMDKDNAPCRPSCNHPTDMGPKWLEDETPGQQDEQGQSMVLALSKMRGRRRNYCLGAASHSMIVVQSSRSLISVTCILSSPIIASHH